MLSHHVTISDLPPVHLPSGRLDPSEGTSCRLESNFRFLESTRSVLFLKSVSSVVRVFVPPHSGVPHGSLDTPKSGALQLKSSRPITTLYLHLFVHLSWAPTLTTLRLCCGHLPTCAPPVTPPPLHSRKESCRTDCLNPFPRTPRASSGPPPLRRY